MDASAIVETMGYVAGALTASSQLPQAWKAWRSRSTADLSIKALAVLATGLALWLAYGVVKGDWPLIVANGVSVAVTLAVIAAKLRFG